jgi:hypothetical protein
MPKPNYVAMLGMVHSTEATNVERLLAALDSLDARYRMQPERKIKPQASHSHHPDINC